jgi:hypothetical protein
MRKLKSLENLGLSKDNSFLLEWTSYKDSPLNICPLKYIEQDENGIYFVTYIKTRDIYNKQIVIENLQIERIVNFLRYNGGDLFVLFSIKNIKCFMNLKEMRKFMYQFSNTSFDKTKYALNAVIRLYEKKYGTSNISKLPECLLERLIISPQNKALGLGDILLKYKLKLEESIYFKIREYCEKLRKFN